MADGSFSQAAATAQVVAPPPRRRFLRPRFSLAALFGVMTLACVGVWYWYQWPYEVEHLTYSSETEPREVVRREVETVRNVWSRERQTVRHGPWAVYDGQGNKLQEGNYRNGAKNGAFVLYDTKGNKVHEERYASGVPHGPIRTWDRKGRLVDDPTGVKAIVPPAGSRLTATLEGRVELEFVDMPARDAFAYLALQGDVRFDSSRLPSQWPTTPININVRNYRWKDALAVVLLVSGCHASLEGETIVIELQE